MIIAFLATINMPFVFQCCDVFIHKLLEYVFFSGFKAATFRVTVLYLIKGYFYKYYMQYVIAEFRRAMSSG